MFYRKAFITFLKILFLNVSAWTLAIFYVYSFHFAEPSTLLHVFGPPAYLIACPTGLIQGMLLPLGTGIIPGTLIAASMVSLAETAILKALIRLRHHRRENSGGRDSIQIWARDTTMKALVTIAVAGILSLIYYFIPTMFDGGLGFLPDGRAFLTILGIGMTAMMILSWFIVSRIEDAKRRQEPKPSTGAALGQALAYDEHDEP
ncbi:MAG: hypothetical protein R3242_01510 [Akkermansiaceae bacterium]|nr:hypothetical protein [Akkermansiaceae bacterium]